MQDGTYIIGRSRSGGGNNRLIIDNPAVSERHAELVILAGCCFLTDLDSRNGTWRVRSDGDRRLASDYVGIDERLRFGVVERSLAELFSGRPLALD